MRLVIAALFRESSVLRAPSRILLYLMDADRNPAKALAHVTKVLGSHLGGANLLGEIAWSRHVEEEFFRKRARALPRATYAMDRAAIGREIRRIREATRVIEGDGPVSAWLRSALDSTRDRGRLMQAAGTREFGVVSREIYGGAKSSFFRMTNLDLAEHVLQRIRLHGSDVARDAKARTCSAKAFGAFALARAKKRGLSFEVVQDERGDGVGPPLGHRQCERHADARAERVEARDAQVIREVEEPLFRAVLEHCDGNQSRAATILGINRGTLRKKLRELGLAS